MTAHRVTYLYCDHEDCQQAEPFDTAPRPGETATEQRADARREGWTRRGGKDYCPEHSAVGQP